MRRRSPSVVVALGLTVAWALAGCGGDAVPEPAARPVMVVQPMAADDAVAAFAGEVRARSETALAFRVGGKLVERRVEVGDHVRAGAVLALLDAGDLQAQARAAQAQLAAAQAELARASADRARFAALVREQLVSRSAMDAHDAAATAAQGQVDAARASLEVARNQTSYSQLRAPAAGVIAARHAEAGQVVGAGEAVFTLAVDGVREIAFAVPEGAIAALRPGQALRVTVWAQPGRHWPARVREIAPAADPASRTFAARASIDAPPGTLQLGQSARVYLPGAGAAALSVPLAALQRRGEAAAVFVVDPATATLRLQPVRIGPYGNDRVPITSGLDPDEWVVAAGGHLLRAGQKVIAVDRDNRPIRP